MPAQEDRVAQLEASVQEHSFTLAAMRDTLARVEQRMDRLEQRMDAKFDAVDRRFERLDDKMSRQFVWTVGVQITTLVAIVAALISRG